MSRLNLHGPKLPIAQWELRLLVICLHCPVEEDAEEWDMEKVALEKAQRYVELRLIAEIERGLKDIDELRKVHAAVKTSTGEA